MRALSSAQSAQATTLTMGGIPAVSSPPRPHLYLHLATRPRAHAHQLLLPHDRAIRPQAPPLHLLLHSLLSRAQEVLRIPPLTIQRHARRLLHIARRPSSPSSQLKAISGTREGGVRRFGVPFGEAAVRYAASANASRVDLGKDLPPGWEDVAGSPSRRLLRRSAAPSMRSADDALATSDPHDALSTPASHGALASPDPRDALPALDSCRPAPVSQRAALVSRRAFTLVSRPPYFFLSLRLVSRPTPLAPPKSAACAHMLRSAAADDSEQRLAAEAYALAESQYGSISRAPAREPRICSVPPKKKKSFAHTAPSARQQHVKARKGVPESVTQGRAREEHLPASDSSTRGESSDSARAFVSTRTGAACLHRAHRTRAESPDSAHVRLAARLTRARRGVVVTCTLARSVRGLFGLVRSKPRPRRLHAAGAVSSRTSSGLYTRPPRRAISTRAYRACPSRHNARAVSII
ncbi:hypothetical protein C8J57DRAFT_1491902 [Mycena rebaudengoi]|nr:hypothetical protein C8J57DRAFT_1491902 [Mycena rebaudengoi]